MSGASLIDPKSTVVVSLTSYGARLDTVHLTIESIGRGRVLPRRFILWTDPDVDPDQLTPALQRQRARGLEILTSSERFGPHTKYYPYVASQEEHVFPLVTADDDSIYPRTWLAALHAAGESFPADIVCFRAHRVTLAGASIAPYNSWPAVKNTKSSRLHFATGVSGVHYPAGFLQELKSDGATFQKVTPNADDVWLHYRAIANGRRVRQLLRRSKKFPELASTQETALHRSNTAQNGNDAQILRTYDQKALRYLAEAKSTGE